MADSDNIRFAVALGIATTAAVTGSVWINSRRNAVRANQSPVAASSPCPNVKWTDQAGFDVFTAMCDAFIPAVDASELTGERVREALSGIHENLHKVFAMDTPAYINSHKGYLCRGALALNIHVAAAEAVEVLITDAEKFQLALMLKVLSTGIGCYFAAGFPLPFQALPLHHRVKALEGWRDSPIAQLRVFYQTVKRLTGNLFFSYVEHGVENPNWKDLSYTPAETVSKGKTKSTAEEDAAKQVDRFLRHKVRYQSVKEALHPSTTTASTTGADAGTNADDASDVLEADVVIVGSGSGGGMVASELAKAGLSVLVLEKGGYFRPAEFKAWRESEAFLHTFEKGGLCSTVDGNVLVLAGSCVGGGSTVNWSASFRTPEMVRQDWVNSGMPQFGKDGAFEESLNAVHGLMNVNTDNSYRARCEDADGACDSGHSACGASFAVNGNNRLLWEGAEKVGFAPEKIPRNVKDCVDCGHCCHGCPYESKQSTATALMEPLLLAGSGLSGQAGEGYRLQVIPHCHVSKVLYENVPGAVRGADGTAHPCNRRAVGVEATVKVFPDNFPDMSVKDRLEYICRGTEIKSRRVFIKAKLVVSAAGALHTPALLLRSGLSHRGMVGAYLTLHPVLGVAGVFPEEKTGLASGVSMGVVVRKPAMTTKTSLADITRGTASTASTTSTTSTTSAALDEEDRHEIAIETPPAHVGLMGLLFPWASGRGSPAGFSGQGGGLGVKLGMLNWPNIATFLALPRDRSQASNRVSIDSQGHPVLHYEVTPQDARLVLLGLEMNMRIIRAAGAKFLYFAHENFGWHQTERTSAEDNEEVRFEEYVRAMHREGIKTARMQIFSAHQMSSCRMAATPETGPTAPSGELFECAGLFVADGSALPTSLGINPMVTIEAVAHMVAGNIVRKIAAEHPQLEREMKAFRAANKRDW